VNSLHITNIRNVLDLDLALALHPPSHHVSSARTHARNISRRPLYLAKSWLCLFLHQSQTNPSPCMRPPFSTKSLPRISECCLYIIVVASQHTQTSHRRG
jgi:hypothetical protein